MKRIISFLISAMLLLSTIPASVFAANLNAGDVLSITSISAKIDGTNAKVTVRAEDAALGTYKLCIAVYADGQMLAADLQDAVFRSTSMVFSAEFENLENADSAKAFFLTANYQPIACKNAALTEDIGNRIAALAKTCTSKPLSSVSGIKAYSDHWYSDSANITADLSNALGLIYSLTVSDMTTFTSTPQTYDRDSLIEWGKDPGLGVDLLHQAGYTGDGAVIAYIDQPLATPLHQEYADTKLHYINTVTDGGGDNSMHGPAVLSLLAGRNIGTAPDAEIYYYAHAAWKADQTTHANCLYQIIDQNRALPEGQKIRMVGFSDNIDDSEANANDFREAVAACEEAGIMVWFCGEYSAANFVPLSDKNDPKNLTTASWGGRDPELVYVPAGSRTTAATMGGSKYIYWSDGGLSWTMPYMLGLYSIAISIDPTLTQEEIRELVVRTAYTNSNEMRIVNPVEFIAGVLDGIGQESEAQQLRNAAEKSRTYLYAILDTAQLPESDLRSIAKYLSCITDASVMIVDAADYSNAAAVYEAIREDHESRGGTIAGIQIFGAPNMVPAFSVNYKVQMPSDIDEGGALLTDLFYGNLNNDSAQISSGYSVCDHFADGMDIDLCPAWPVARLPLGAGEFSAFFEKYDAFAMQTELTKQTLVNFSNPIFASNNHLDDMGTFLNRMHSEFGLIDSDYALYGNQKGQYPVTTEVIGDFSTDNLSAVNQNDVVEFLINAHGQRNNIDCCYYKDGQELRESLVNTSNINTVLQHHPYYLDCWTCSNGYGMDNNLVTTALKGNCVGAFAATTILSNNGANCNASLDQMKQSNFYYFYYQYLKALNASSTRSQAFFAAQKAYAEALLADSRNDIRGEGNYQFNLYNLLAYENFGIIEPNVIASAMYDNAGHIEQAGQSVPKDPQEPDDVPAYENNALTIGKPIGSSWSVPYRVKTDCVIPESYSFYGLTAQQLDTGYIRMTLDFEAPAGMYIDAFNPPEGSLFMLFGDRTSGQRETFTYDLSYEDLLQCGDEDVVMKIFGGGKEENECQYVMASAKDIISGYDASKAPKLQDVPFASNNKLTDSNVEIHSYRYEKLENGDYRFYLKLTATEGMETFLFDPPNGDLISERFYKATGRPQYYVFEISAADIAAVDGVTFNIYASDTDKYLMWFRSSDLRENPQEPDDVPAYENNALTIGKPIGSSWSVPYRVNTDCVIPESYSFYGLTAQQLDTGYIRMTLDFEAPAGMYIDAFNPPEGSLFMLFGDRTSGQRETFTYDLSYEDLLQCGDEDVVMKIFGGGKEENECQYVIVAAKDIIAEYDASKAPKLQDVPFTSTDELTDSSVEIHSYRYEKLENGDYRFYLKLTATKGMRTCLFNPPNGNLMKEYFLKTSGRMQTYIFEISDTTINTLESLAFNIVVSDTDRYLVYFRPSEL